MSTPDATGPRPFTPQQWLEHATAQLNSLYKLFKDDGWKADCSLLHGLSIATGQINEAIQALRSETPAINEPMGCREMLEECVLWLKVGLPYMPEKGVDDTNRATGERLAIRPLSEVVRLIIKEAEAVLGREVANVIPASASSARAATDEKERRELVECLARRICRDLAHAIDSIPLTDPNKTHFRERQKEFEKTLGDTAQYVHDLHYQIRRLSLPSVDRMRTVLKDISEYTGQGPETTPWQDIVKTMSDTARAALEGN